MTSHDEPCLVKGSLPPGSFPGPHTPNPLVPSLGAARAHEGPPPGWSPPLPVELAPPKLLEPPKKPKTPKKPPGEDFPLPADLDTPEFRAAWSEWLKDRRERGIPVTFKAAGMQLRAIGKYGVAAGIWAIEAAMTAQHQSLHPENYRPPIVAGARASPPVIRPGSSVAMAAISMLAEASKNPAADEAYRRLREKKAWNPMEDA